jgi:hypothetical protein
MYFSDQFRPTKQENVTNIKKLKPVISIISYMEKTYR